MLIRILTTFAILGLSVVQPHARTAYSSQGATTAQFKETLQGKWQMTSRIADGVPSAMR
jgi:hypothetical protein